MNKEVDLSKYQIRTDLTIEELENKNELKGVKSKNTAARNKSRLSKKVNSME